MIRKLVLAAVAITGVALAALFVATWQLSGAKFDGRLAGDPLDTLVIAPVDRALTLARTTAAGGSRVVLVTRSGPEGLGAVDLEAAFGRTFRDAVDAFLELGFEALADAAEAAESMRVSVEDLGIPLDPAYPHIAAGTNFRAHAEEVGHDEGPFLFPKLSAPTPWNSDVPARTRLDYEAELCAVTLTPHTAREPARFGYVLCNDFTDRWTLVRQMDFSAPMGTTGFPDGKGGEGMLPIGPLLVVPRDPDAFYRDLSLRLYVNGRLRQRATAGQMIWPPAAILTRALEACDTVYHREEGTLGLADCAGIPPRTLVLTGTPAGVLFHPVTLWSAGAYLGSGDEVVTTATHLGVLRNRVR